MNLNPKRKLQAILFILAMPVIAFAFAAGPDPGYAGAPGDLGNCTSCHAGTPNSGGGNLTISGVPQAYQPGQQYTVMVTVQQGGRIRFGFQMTVIDSNGNGAGMLESLGADTQIKTIPELNNRQYIEHTAQGNSATSSGTRIWQVRWTAPATNIGPVRFFAAGNAANNNGQDTGDSIYLTNVQSDPNFVPFSLSLTSQIDGQVLTAGSIHRISWNVSGQSNLDNVEIRYSTDDGATFPLSNRITTITDPSITSFDWIVPNMPTTTARLRIQANPKSGNTVEVQSGRFTIQGDGVPTSKPTVTGVTVSGKKLTVMGNNFQDGAVILINGAEQNTTNGDPPSQVLKSKKGGKKIKPGVTVDITVKNPDGQTSDSFLFTRPDS